MFVLFIILTNSCNLFETRTPEPPTGQNEQYQPPTSADIVLSNFINSLKQKNIDYYIMCLTDDSKTTEKQNFEFIPSSDALAKYSSLFDFWNLSNERSYLVSLFSNLSTEVYPEIKLENSKFEVLLPDSSVFISDYNIAVNHNSSSLNKIFSGSLQFTIIRNSNGMWFIRRWLDIKQTNDTIKNTWSILKAEFSN